MSRFAEKIPYLNKQIAKKRNKGQGLVEFAMISLILFMLVIGVLEMGRMMFIWTQLTSAAQEGARYGMSHPREIIDANDEPPPPTPQTYPSAAHNPDPCNIVTQARRRVVLVPTDTIGVEVGYDNSQGQPATPVYPFQNLQHLDFSPTHYRVVVTTTYQFHFLIGIFDNFAPDGLRMQMVAARTIQVNQTATPGPSPTPDCTDGEP
jgi:hypothetical protein